MANLLKTASRKKAKPGKTITYKRQTPGGWWGRLVDAADRKAFNWNTRLAFYNHLAAQVENDVPVEQAIEAYAETLKKRGRKSTSALVANIARRMREGMTLRKAIAIAVPRDELAVIAGGELSGELAKALDVVIASHDRVDDVVRAYREAISLPIFYFVMTYTVLWVIGGWVMPQITLTLPENKVMGLGLLMYQAADFSQSWWVVVPPILCALAIGAAARSLPRWKGPKRVKAERYFPYSFYRDIEGFKWLTTFNAMIEAGMSDVQILSEQMNTASPWLRERLYHIHFRMTEGGVGLAKALEAKGLRGMPPFEFPNPDIVDSLRSIDGFEDFNTRVARLTQRWAVTIEQSAKARAKRIGFIAEMSIYAVMALLMVAINSVTTQLGAVGG